MKARSVLFSGASFFESSSSFTKILTARLSRFICNDVTTTTTQELRDALEAKGLDSSGLKAVLLSRLEESLEGGEGGGEEEKEEEEAEEEPLSADEIEEEEKEPTPEPESEAPAAPRRPRRPRLPPPRRRRRTKGRNQTLPPQKKAN